MRMRRFAALILMLFLAVMSAAGAAEIKSVEELNRKGIKVGVGVGSAAILIVEKELPNAEIQHYNDIPGALESVAQGKLDAFIYDRRQMQLALDSGLKGVHLLDENMKEGNQIAVGISPLCRIPDFENKINAFIAESKSNGILDDMLDRWAVKQDETMPEIEPAVNPEYQLTVGTSGIAPPYTYYGEDGLTGYDIELAYRFAAWLGAELTFKVYDYSAIISAAATGDVDCIMANLNITPERAEALTFSQPLYTEELGVVVQGENSAETDNLPESLKDLKGKYIGSATGTVYDDVVLKYLPDAKFKYFTTYSDMVAALSSDKISGFPCDETALKMIIRENSQVGMLPDVLDSYDIAYIFPKNESGQALCDEMSAFIREMKSSGELDKLKEKWIDGNPKTAEMPNIDELNGEKGELVMAAGALNMPFVFVRGKEIVGFEIEMAILFCRQAGYTLKIQDMQFDGILAAVQTGKADFGGTSISVTPERAETVLFSEPHYQAGVVMAVLRDDTYSGMFNKTFKGIFESFEKTFIREKRWRLFTSGVVTTMVITVLSILFGTILGFCVFMLCRNGNRAANAAVSLCMRLLTGMPTVVLLMILYYIIFGSVSISGIVVSVIGFTMTFGTSVYSLLSIGVGAVDHGQYEAAYALGYSSIRTFFRIILPQAVPHVLPAYKGEIVGLIKATSVVGYIAVQDLTKMGDIVRSRTYEAFFPLIAVTVIYFLLEGLLGFFVSKIEIGTNPKKRKPEDILRGIRTENDI